MRPGEATILNKIRMNPGLRYALDEPAKTYADKVFLLMQAHFSDLKVEADESGTNTAPSKVNLAIFQQAPRISRGESEKLSLAEVSDQKGSASEKMGISCKSRHGAPARHERQVVG